MRLRVDPKRCVGHLCCDEATEFFESSDDLLQAVATGEVPPAEEDKARQVVSLCPEHAIVLIE